MYNIERRDKEISALLDWAYKGIENGSHYPGMSYEEGILRTLDWLFGEDDNNPSE